MIRYAITIALLLCAAPGWAEPTNDHAPGDHAVVPDQVPDNSTPSRPLDDEQPPDSHRFGVEINLVQPFIPTVHIIRPKATWTIWGDSGDVRGDAILGLYIRPHVAHDIVDTIDEYMGTLGYRQYLWRGLHLETMISAGVAWGTNKLDGKDYTTTSLFMDVNGGYRLGFFEPGGLIYDEGGSTGFYLAAQGGIIFSLGVADIGPRNGKPDYFPQGDVLAGISF